MLRNGRPFFRKSIKTILGPGTHPFVRALHLLPAFVNVNIQQRYARINTKGSKQLLHQALLASESGNKDADFWRRVGERFKELLKKKEEDQLSYFTHFTNQPSLPPQEDATVPRLSYKDVTRLYLTLCRQGRYDPDLDLCIIRDSVAYIKDYSVQDLTFLAECFAHLNPPCNMANSWFEAVGDYLTAPSDTLKLQDVRKVRLIKLLSAFRDANVSHQGLFTAAAPLLIEDVLSRRRLAGEFLVDIISSYARFGFRHKRLLTATTSRIVLGELTDSQLVILQNGLKAIQFACPILDALAKLRLDLPDPLS